MRSSVDLPDPERPSRRNHLAFAQRQVDVVQHHEIGGGVLVVGLFAVPDLEQRLLGDDGVHRRLSFNPASGVVPNSHTAAAIAGG